MTVVVKDNTTHDKFLHSISSIKSQVCKMDDAVSLAYACMLANQPCLYVGNPGTGKSHTFKLIASMFGMRDCAWFYQSITAKTSPEKLIGGIIAEKMLEGIETYNLAVGAAAYKAIIFDELFKSQHPAMMDMLLSFFDEKPTIFSGGKNQTPVWEFAFATTNFEDLEDDLRFDPLWDRMAAKYIVNNLSSSDSKKTLIDSIHLKGKQEKLPTIEWDDLYKSRTRANSIKVDHLIDHFYDRVLPILEKYAYVSQRKIHSIFLGKPGKPSILQALSYLQQDNSTEILGFIPYFVWQDRDTFNKLLTEIQGVVILPIIKTYKEIKRDLEKLIMEIESGYFNSYDIARQRSDMILEAATASSNAYSKADKGKVPAELRDSIISLRKQIPVALNKLVNSAIDDVEF